MNRRRRFVFPLLESEGWSLDLVRAAYLHSLSRAREGDETAIRNVATARDVPAQLVYFRINRAGLEAELEEDAFYRSLTPEQRRRFRALVSALADEGELPG